jgi:hypothetical protein
MEKIWQINKKAMIHVFVWEKSMFFNAFYLFLASNIELCSKFTQADSEESPKLWHVINSFAHCMQSPTRFFD